MRGGRLRNEASEGGVEGGVEGSRVRREGGFRVGFGIE